jgi:hypothetical protein
MDEYRRFAGLVKERDIVNGYPPIMIMRGVIVRQKAFRARVSMRRSSG